MTEIINVEVHEYFDNGPLIEVIAKSNGKSEMFFVETFNGEYVGDCSIIRYDSDEHVNQDDYPDFDFDKIIDAAEKLSQSFYTKTEYYHDGYRIWIHQSDPCTFWVCKVGTEFFPTIVIDNELVDSFYTLEEALEYAKEVADE